MICLPQIPHFMMRESMPMSKGSVPAMCPSPRAPWHETQPKQTLETRKKNSTLAQFMGGSVVVVHSRKQDVLSLDS